MNDVYYDLCHHLSPERNGFLIMSTLVPVVQCNLFYVPVSGRDSISLGYFFCLQQNEPVPYRTPIHTGMEILLCIVTVVF
jgi:hypothetical protein